MALKVGDPMIVELALCNAGFAQLLLGRWDDVLRQARDWLADRELTPFACAVVANVSWVQVQRGEPVPEPVAVEESEDAWEVLVHVLWRALHERSLGVPGEAVRRIPAAFHDIFGDSETFEDFEILWAPSVELTLWAGDVDAAERMVAAGAPLDGPLGRALTRGELPRLRGLVTAARGADPEADLRAAIRSHDEYGAPYLAARARLKLGRWLHGQGRGSEAEPLLATAREVFLGLGARPSVEEVDALAVAVPA